MPVTLKELIVVLFLSVPAFYFARPYAVLFMSAQDFALRRRVWWGLTCALFLSPNFWIFCLVAALILNVAARRDSNPSALYLFALHVVPPASLPIPMIGISYLFNLDVDFLLSFCILLPTALKLFGSQRDPRHRGLRILDLSLLAFGLLTSVLYLRLQDPNGELYDVTVTDCLRRAFVFFFTLFIPYYVISRSITKRAALTDMMAAFCLSCALMAVTAMFESVRNWLLYPEVIQSWGIPGTRYVMRGWSVRAMASSGHPLALGYLLAIAVGFWLFLQHNVQLRSRRVCVFILFWLGLIASYSRGPWIGAVAIYFLFALLGPSGTKKLIRAVALFASILAILSLTPLADRVIKVMPFLGGTVDSQNIEYRQRLFDRSWEIIKQNPIFGDQTARLRMQDLTQGEGIIDIINTYLQILLDNGFVGLSLFLTFILLAAYRAFVRSRQLAKSDPDISRLGACLIACTIGTLLMIESGGCDNAMVSVLVGLLAAYVCLDDSKVAPEPARSRLAPRSRLTSARGGAI